MQPDGEVFIANVTGVRDVASSGESTLRFFTQFSDPQKDIYAWNGSFPEARLAFLGGILATYFGFASELADIRAGNPNLNFDVARVPQINANTPVTYGRLLVAAVPRGARDLDGVYRAIGALTSAEASGFLAAELNFPPVRRDLLGEEPTEAFRSVFYRSALIAQTYLDPGRTATAAAFESAIAGISSGRLTLFEAVSRIETAINDALAGR